MMRPRRRSSNIRLALYLLVLVLIAGYLVNRQRGATSNEDLTYEEDLGTYAHTSKSRKGERAFVVASQEKDDVAWLYDYFPDWTKYRYIVDNPKAELRVPINKGRESMVYLTFIIDNYDNLPDYTLFLHPTRYQWHNDDPDYDGLMVLRNFQVPYLEQEGYVNLRCAWQLGCPNEIKPYENDPREKQQQGHAGNSYYHAFKEIFGEAREVPHEVGVSCCAQFALTRDKIREIPRSEYVRLREWLAKTPLLDSISGRVMEYSWHILFGKEPIHCPSAQDCYCKVFGLCDLRCPEIGMCDGRYVLPPFSSLPNGWPYVGWDSGPRERIVEPGVPS
ncbi:hypothetical protein DBV05_g7525 [Lasiodiplodia theobromae]|uniref:Uncharacterized protein n=1 Tax=Lasiodiplodia theobromae TaxID=45133 RepID=A0A5N5D7N0_9PEZI|nr:hypothetical protein DBV05_g7525 [Lasiodiplodia theobromae]